MGARQQQVVAIAPAKSGLKVEYTIVYDGTLPNIISKVQTKVDEGWFLSGGIMRSVVTSNSSSTQYHQALWRWED